MIDLKKVFTLALLFGGAATIQAIVAPTLSQAASSAIESIKEHARARSETLALLKSEDPELAMAAFEEAVAGDDPELRLSAFETAFTSQYPRLRKAALRYFLNGRSEIRMEVVLPDRPDKAQKYLFDADNGQRFFKLEVDPRTDIITLEDSSWSGQLVTDGIDLTFNNKSDRCVMNLRIADDERLTGQLQCFFQTSQILRTTEGLDHATVAVVIRLS